MNLNLSQSLEQILNKHGYLWSPEERCVVVEHFFYDRNFFCKGVRFLVERGVPTNDAEDLIQRFQLDLLESPCAYDPNRKPDVTVINRFEAFFRNRIGYLKSDYFTPRKGTANVSSLDDVRIGSDGETIVNQIASNAPNPEKEWLEKERTTLVNDIMRELGACVEALPPKQKQAFTDIHHRKLSYEEMANERKTDKLRLRKRYFDAKYGIRACLEKKGITKLPSI